jgi:signal transduction histidine kinase
VSTAVDFPHLAVDPAFDLPAFLVDAASTTHAVQFYEHDAFLFDTVAKFINAGLFANERIFLIATEDHTDAFLGRVDKGGLQRARKEGRFTILDARATLAKFMVDDMPDARKFHAVVEKMVDDIPADVPRVPVRAYGEMVDLLAKDGNLRASVRLEQLWHEALQKRPFAMLCAYLMGNFCRPCDGEHLAQVCASHSHVIPTESFVALMDPNARLREVLLLQQRDNVLKSEVKQREKLERALSEALRDLGKVEGELLGWVKREQDARQRVLSSDAFQERFLGIVGHDLHNPLNTILTTVRMMALRKELAPESQARLERVVASSVRMQRMIEQLLDVARARLPDGISVRLGDARDLEPIVLKIVHEVRAANPSRSIHLKSFPCRARVDAERLEQVVWSLLTYLTAHAEGESRIRVELRQQDATAVIRLESPGLYVDRALLPQLFDSFHLETAPEVGMEGLTLGLCVAKRILVAHGGMVAASSSEETGTTLEAILPLA